MTDDTLESNSKFPLTKGGKLSSPHVKSVLTDSQPELFYALKENGVSKNICVVIAQGLLRHSAGAVNENEKFIIVVSD